MLFYGVIFHIINFLLQTYSFILKSSKLFKNRHKVMSNSFLNLTIILND